MARRGRSSWTVCSRSIPRSRSRGWPGCAAAWLPPPAVVKAELDKLEFLRRHGADDLDLSRLPAGRRRPIQRCWGNGRFPYQDGRQFGQDHRWHLLSW